VLVIALCCVSKSNACFSITSYFFRPTNRNRSYCSIIPTTAIPQRHPKITQIRSVFPNKNIRQFSILAK